MAEATELGRERFVEDNGFGYATTYLLQHDGHVFDPKAIVGVAHRFVSGRDQLRAHEFDATEAIQRLRQLGYSVVSFNGLWWVNQSATYDEERRGGFVSAPQQASRGVRSAITRPSKFASDRRSFTAQTRRSEQSAPSLPNQQSKQSHHRSAVIGTRLDTCAESRTATSARRSPKTRSNRTPEVGPFDVNGNLKQAYLTKVNDPQLFPLLDFLLSAEPDLFEPASADELRAVSAPLNQEEPAMEDPLVRLLLSAKNIVLEGVPGPGKSFAIETISKRWEAITGRQIISRGGSAVRSNGDAPQHLIRGLHRRSPSDLARRGRRSDEVL